MPDGVALDAVEQAGVVLDSLAELPVSDHVAGFDAVHRLLQDALATVDEV